MCSFPVVALPPKDSWNLSSKDAGMSVASCFQFECFVAGTCSSVGHVAQ